ncbi:unnamed protein product [Plutella xylostella]|nr:unnamed protein product [Plutella xylostella]
MFKLVVLSTLMAAATASVVGPWGLGPLGVGHLGLAGPLGLGGHLGLGVPALAAPLAVGHWGGVSVAPAIGAYNYRGPLSLAPGQPANILAADGRPLDTLSVNLDRAAHITAKAVSGAHGHLLKKRSAPLWGPAVAVSHSSRIDLPARVLAPAPLALAAPGHLGLAGPLVGPYGVGPLGLGYGHGLGLGHGLALGHGLGHLW